jgi:hypothetical protein
MGLSTRIDWSPIKLIVKRAHGPRGGRLTWWECRTTYGTRWAYGSHRQAMIDNVLAWWPNATFTTEGGK